MAKNKQLRAIVERIKEHTPRWSWLHALLDALVGEALFAAASCVIFVATATYGLVKQFAVDPLAVFLIAFGSIGAVVTGVQWCLRSIPRACSKLERRCVELLEEAEHVCDVTSASIWLMSARSFLSMTGDFEGWTEFDRIELGFDPDADDIHTAIKNAANLLKNYAATRKDSGD